MLEQVQTFFADGSWVDMVVPFIVNLFVALGIYIIGSWVATHIVKLIDKGMQLRNMDPVLRGFLIAIIGTVFSFVIVLIAVEQLGVNVTSLLALLGAAGLAVGLALKDSLGNFASGVMLILFKPFKIGDYVEAGGTAGIVEKIEVFNTVMRSGDNKQIIVPNSQIYGGTITNYSAKPTRRVDMVFGIGYDDDMKKARDLIWEVLNADERILKDPAPVVAVNELGASSVDFIARPWVNAADYWAVKWETTEAIKNIFDANGVSIPYPQRDVHLYTVDK